MKTAIYVAIAENGVIGREGGLPWRLSTDLKRFKADTMGKPVIMGRKTYEGIGRLLPGRLNIIVTRDTGYSVEGAEIAHSLDEAIGIAERHVGPDGEACVIGGGEIYAQALPLVDRLHVTHVLGTVEGDASFPAIDSAIWRETASQDVPSGERDSHATRYVVYERRG
ncbi:dihydrofolate reductase [Aquamicrobium ahrensii]|uniref:Dihydrofolate reductase n=1 Tax=Aquamicrobium ahrensii TaxID=469551 RepID=A0ABV2KJJ3_9HYPH